MILINKFSETAAEILQRVDHYNAVFLDCLHHLLHQVLWNRYAAAGVWLERAEAVQKDRGAAAGGAVLIKADRLKIGQTSFGNRQSSV